MSEQSETPNSQTQQTPGEHQAAIQERIMAVLEGKPKPGTEVAKPEEAAPTETTTDEAAPQDSAEQAEQSAETETTAEDAKTTDAADKPLPEVVDVEYAGKAYKVPQELKDALLRQQDYTKKTQEVAEAKKTADSVLQEANKIFELQKAQQKQYGQLAAIDDQIAQYEKVDWNTLTAQDATRAQQLFIAFQQAKDSKTKIMDELRQAQNQQMEAANTARRAKLEEGEKALRSDPKLSIKDWNADLGKKLMGFASETYGFSADELSGIMDARVVKALHDASLYRQQQAAKTTVTEKRVAPPSATLKPKAGEQKSSAQQAYDADKRALRNAKDPTAMTKAAERIILRKLG